MYKILIIGSNDNATAAAIRLFRAGFSVSLLSKENSYDLYSYRNFSAINIVGSKTIMGVKALTFADFLYNHQDDQEFSLTEFLDFSFQNRRLPVLIPADFKKIARNFFNFFIICEADLLKKLNIEKSLETKIICCEKNCPGIIDYFVFTNGFYTGQVKYPFLDYQENEKYHQEYMSLYSDIEGVFISEKVPGDKVKKGEKLAEIGDSILHSDYDGFVSGIMRDGIIVPEKQEVVRMINSEPWQDLKSLPMSAFAVAGGILEAILHNEHLNRNN